MATFLPAQTIDEVLDRLDAIIESALHEDSRAGYFAVLYRDVTVRVREGIRTGRFEDGPRMGQLDVIFANRYLQAYRGYLNDDTISSCWEVTLEAGKDNKLIVLQHLLLGMNAHINLDLGIAAAETAPGSDLPALERDFRTINQLLVEMLEAVQERLGRVSPLMRLLDRVGGKHDEWFARLGLRGFRDGAWLTAQMLAPLSPPAREEPIRHVDRTATLVGRAIQNPPGLFFGFVLFLVRRTERRPPSEIMSALRRTE